MKKLNFIQLLILLIGAVLGNLIARLSSGVSYLSWLAFGDTFGVSPFTVDLGVAELTFGLTFELSIAAIIGLILAIIICRKLR
ncbi:MAG: DUF4321 domain-containing protein [Butyricicoccus sp.]|nr:DUF4321 domain-containing protein [Butyricicoccus sp.]MBQ8585142.1 DUF4321 domain-containing protein [Butyricicoccus sp.]